ncbi:NUDIX hydrolase [Demequina sp.]|uniref:NUDIX hydrolase n=1 Tax=Demequina sp. TaxID=2050685 RepID=UPI003A8B20BC
MTGVIHVSAVVLRDERGAILTVRKRGTQRFMLPGGKPEPGEGPRAAAARECAEEIGFVVAPEALSVVGEFSAPAANEPGWQVQAHVYSHPAPPRVSAAAEIAELRWLVLDGTALPDDLAPLLETKILPALGHEGPSQET